LRDGQYFTLEYLSADGGSRTTSTLQAWDVQRQSYQQFSNSQADGNYPEHSGENWAVVIGTSDTWAYYRHQADALAMYQLLKRHGYDDDHIILVIADNIAYDSHNIYPGVVKVRPDGENVYEGAVIDYRLDEIYVDDLKAIMTGQKSERYPQVIAPDSNDNVVVFWCGHGAKNALKWGSDDVVYDYQIASIIEAMEYRKMLWTMDACYSGTIGEACEGIPGLLVITSANAYEPSKADVKDPEMGIWLSNGFTREFQETVDANPSISLRDLYYELARNTVGSHATVYNVENYGNMYKESMNEYF
jgi:glycosylphosphatidylinositol transamidase (GPIT) subunit GPI8